MQSLRIHTPTVYRISKAVPVQVNARNMSFFPRFASGEFTPLFRLLDDYATHTVSRNTCSGYRPTALRSFQPRFDVKEGKDAYELEGELPGIDQKDVNIEFTDPQTLSVKGRVERVHESGTPTPAVEDQPAQDAATPEPSETGSTYHKATVEDDTNMAGANPDAPTTSESTEVTAQPAQHAVTPQAKRPTSRYWVSERSVGEFQRTFNFPSRIDQDNVKASLKNGVLSIFVPKAQAPVARRINVE